MIEKIAKTIAALIIFLAGLYLILSFLARPAGSHPFFEQIDAPRPWVIAHQGGDGLRPGNTMIAFEHAVELGVDMLEMDMHMTADGVMVILHDTTVDRTTDGSGAVKDMTLAQIKALDAAYHWPTTDEENHPYRGQGITIPTLEEIFIAFPDMPMNVEIKQVEQPVGQPLCQLIRQYGMEDKVLVASFRQPLLDEFREACPEAATSAAEDEVRAFFIMNLLLLNQIYSPGAYYAFQVPERRGNLHILTPRFVRSAQGRNLDVHAWTINERQDMERMINLGVDGIITDYPDRLLDLLGR